MPSVLLELEGARYGWPLPDGGSRVTVAGLKESIKERTEKKVLYHEKLKFSPGALGQPLADDEEVPLGPAVLKVGGPGSVVNMFALWCKSNLASREWAEDGPRPQQPAPAPKPRKVSSLAPQATPIQAWKPGPKAPKRTSGVAPTVARQPAAQPEELAARSARLLERIRRQQAGLQAPERRREPQSHVPIGSAPASAAADVGLQGLGTAWPPGLGFAYEPLPADWTDAASGQGDAAALEDWENAALLQAATELSQRHLQADEEAQLKWAIEESMRLAQEAAREDDQDLYGPGDGSSDVPEESSDEEPPPLELIPNSEE